MDDAPVPHPGPEPGAPVTEEDRQAIVAHLQRAVASDVVPFEELDDRLGLVFAADTRSELDAAVADLPTPPPPEYTPTVGHLAPGRSIRLIGDTRIGGAIDLDRNLTCVTGIGDVFIDLSSAELPDDVTITAWSIIGGAVVVVPDGVRVSVSTVTLIGDRKGSVTPARAGAPTVRIEVRTAIGDAKVYSLSQLPKGRLRKLWRRLRAE